MTVSVFEKLREIERTLDHTVVVDQFHGEETERNALELFGPLRAVAEAADDLTWAHEIEAVSAHTDLRRALAALRAEMEKL